MASNSPWIFEALAGVFVLQGFGARTDALVKHVCRTYGGPSFGGLDYMPPNEADEAWLIVGVWTDCLDEDNRSAITAFRDVLVRAVDLDRAGASFGDDHYIIDTQRAFPDSPRGELRTLYLYTGELAINWWEQPEIRARIESVFPSLPGYLGLHMGAPHWLGYGMRRDGDRILAVTPYIRLDFDESRGILLNAVAEPRDFEPWLAALRTATNWP